MQDDDDDFFQFGEHRYSAILDGLASEEEMQRLESLSSLCETLTFDTTAAYDFLRPPLVLPLLVPLIHGPEAPPPFAFDYDDDDDDDDFGGNGGWALEGEVALQAIRCVCMYLEVSPRPTAAALARLGGVSALVKRLEAIDSMEVADQSVSALRIIASHEPLAVIGGAKRSVSGVTAAAAAASDGGGGGSSDNGLVALLTFLDFYALSTQRAAVETCALACRGVPSNRWRQLHAAAPVLTRLLGDPAGSSGGAGSGKTSHAHAALKAISNALRSVLRVQPFGEHQRVEAAATPNLRNGCEARLLVVGAKGAGEKMSAAAAAAAAVLESIASEALMNVLTSLLSRFAFQYQETFRRRQDGKGEAGGGADDPGGDDEGKEAKAVTPPEEKVDGTLCGGVLQALTLVVGAPLPPSLRNRILCPSRVKAMTEDLSVLLQASVKAVTAAAVGAKPGRRNCDSEDDGETNASFPESAQKSVGSLLLQLLTLLIELTRLGPFQVNGVVAVTAEASLVRHHETLPTTQPAAEAAAPAAAMPMVRVVNPRGVSVRLISPTKLLCKRGQGTPRGPSTVAATSATSASDLRTADSLTGDAFADEADDSDVEGQETTVELGFGTVLPLLASVDVEDGGGNEGDADGEVQGDETRDSDGGTRQRHHLVGFPCGLGDNRAFSFPPAPRDSGDRSKGSSMSRPPNHHNQQVLGWVLEDVRGSSLSLVYDTTTPPMTELTDDDVGGGGQKRERDAVPSQKRSSEINEEISSIAAAATDAGAAVIAAAAGAGAAGSSSSTAATTATTTNKQKNEKHAVAVARSLLQSCVSLHSLAMQGHFPLAVSACLAALTASLTRHILISSRGDKTHHSPPRQEDSQLSKKSSSSLSSAQLTWCGNLLMRARKNDGEDGGVDGGDGDACDACDVSLCENVCALCSSALTNNTNNGTAALHALDIAKTLLLLLAQAQTMAAAAAAVLTISRALRRHGVVDRVEALFHAAAATPQRRRRQEGDNDDGDDDNGGADSASSGGGSPKLLSDPTPLGSSACDELFWRQELVLQCTALEVLRISTSSCSCGGTDDVESRGGGGSGANDVVSSSSSSSSSNSSSSNSSSSNSSSSSGSGGNIGGGNNVKDDENAAKDDEGFDEFGYLKLCVARLKFAAAQEVALVLELANTRRHTHHRSSHHRHQNHHHESEEETFTQTPASGLSSPSSPPSSPSSAAVVAAAGASSSSLPPSLAAAEAASTSALIALLRTLVSGHRQHYNRCAENQSHSSSSSTSSNRTFQRRGDGGVSVFEWSSSSACATLIAYFTAPPPPPPVLPSPKEQQSTPPFQEETAVGPRALLAERRRALTAFRALTKLRRRRAEVFLKQSCAPMPPPLLLPRHGSPSTLVALVALVQRSLSERCAERLATTTMGRPRQRLEVVCSEPVGRKRLSLKRRAKQQEQHRSDTTMKAQRRRRRQRGLGLNDKNGDDDDTGDVSGDGGGEPWDEKDTEEPEATKVVKDCLSPRSSPSSPSSLTAEALALWLDRPLHLSLNVECLLQVGNEDDSDNSDVAGNGKGVTAMAPVTAMKAATVPVGRVGPVMADPLDSVEALVLFAVATALPALARTLAANAALNERRRKRRLELSSSSSSAVGVLAKGERQVGARDEGGDDAVRQSLGSGSDEAVACMTATPTSANERLTVSVQKEVAASTTLTASILASSSSGGSKNGGNKNGDHADMAREESGLVSGKASNSGGESGGGGGGGGSCTEPLAHPSIHSTAKSTVLAPSRTLDAAPTLTVAATRATSKVVAVTVSAGGVPLLRLAVDLKTLTAAPLNDKWLNLQHRRRQRRHRRRRRRHHFGKGAAANYEVVEEQAEQEEEEEVTLLQGLFGAQKLAEQDGRAVRSRQKRWQAVRQQGGAAGAASAMPPATWATMAPSLDMWSSLHELTVTVSDCLAGLAVEDTDEDESAADDDDDDDGDDGGGGDDDGGNTTNEDGDGGFPNLGLTQMAVFERFATNSVALANWCEDLPIDKQLHPHLCSETNLTSEHFHREAAASVAVSSVPAPAAAAAAAAPTCGVGVGGAFESDHPIESALIDAEQRERAREAATLAAADGGGGGVGGVGRRQAEVSLLGGDDPVLLDTLVLLRLLHSIATTASQAARTAPFPTNPAEVPLPTAEEWVNSALSNRLASQLDGPLVLATAGPGKKGGHRLGHEDGAREASPASSNTLEGCLRVHSSFASSSGAQPLLLRLPRLPSLPSSLPPWTFTLAEECPFLFPLALRTRWVHGTCFGPSHALRTLHRLKADQLAEAERCALEAVRRLAMSRDGNLKQQQQQQQQRTGTASTSLQGDRFAMVTVWASPSPQHSTPPAVQTAAPTTTPSAATAAVSFLPPPPPAPKQQVTVVRGDPCGALTAAVDAFLSAVPAEHPLAPFLRESAFSLAALMSSKSESESSKSQAYASLRSKEAQQEQEVEEQQSVKPFSPPSSPENVDSLATATTAAVAVPIEAAAVVDGAPNESRSSNVDNDDDDSDDGGGLTAVEPTAPFPSAPSRSANEDEGDPTGRHRRESDESSTVMPPREQQKQQQGGVAQKENTKKKKKKKKERLGCRQQRGTQVEASFLGEPGTGNGPTAEFFTLFSNQLAQFTMPPTSIPLWRGGGGETGESTSLDAFFPAATPSAKKSSSSSSPSWWGTSAVLLGSLGWAMAHCLQEGHLLDLPLAPPLVELLLKTATTSSSSSSSSSLSATGQGLTEATTTTTMQEGRGGMLGDQTSALAALRCVDSSLSHQLESLLAQAEKYLTRKELCKLQDQGQEQGQEQGQAKHHATATTSDGDDDDGGDPIETLSLDWTLPGRPDVRLLPRSRTVSSGKKQKQTKKREDVSGKKKDAPRQDKAFVNVVGAGEGQQGGEDLEEEEDEVTSERLNEWVALVLHHTLLGASPLLAASLRCGFSSVCDPARFVGSVLSPRELAVILTGSDEEGFTAHDPSSSSSSSSSCRKAPLGSDAGSILCALDCAHGYDRTSPCVQSLTAVLAGLNPSEQHKFLRFVTGSPRLPFGGLGALRPRLTVVRKEASSSSSTTGGATATTAAAAAATELQATSEVLPSASTCTNYLKLPDYGSEQRLRERLLVAIHEGQCAFYLS